MSTTGLEARQLRIGYGDGPVIDGLDFQVPRGRFTAVLGPNGCGKSTLVKSLSRVLRTEPGMVLLDGRPLNSYRPRQLARHLALLPQHPAVPDGVTVRGLVNRGRYPYHSALRQWSAEDAPAIAGALADTGLDELRDTPVADLSGGQRQRTWLAMVLAQQTEYVLLDEPTSFLDISHQIEVLRLCRRIARSGRTVLAVLHDLNQAARYADELMVMHQGRIFAQGTHGEVLTPELLREVFNLEAMIAADPCAGTPTVVPVGED